MEKRKYSPTYVRLLEMFLKLQARAKEHQSYSQSVNSNGIKSVVSGSTTSVHQEFTMADTGLYARCTAGEWHLIGRIMSELCLFNALWECPDKTTNSTLRRSIKGLIEKDILIPTEDSKIFLVNPLIMRRGDLFQVIATTAMALREHSKVHGELIGDKKAIRNMDLTSGDHMLLITDGTEH